MASLRRLLISGVRTRLRSLSCHSHASPQGGGFRDAPHSTLQRFPLRRLLTTPSLSAGMPFLARSSAQGSPAPPTNPAAGRGEGGKTLRDLIDYFKSVARMKALAKILASIISVLLANEAVYVCLASWGDVPKGKKRQKDRLWIASENLPTEALLDKSPETFYLLVGDRGIGKTTRVCDAARARGAAIYVDAAAAKSLKDIQAALNRKYRGLLLNTLSWITSNDQSGLETLSSLALWVRRITGKNLVFIVDHVDKLAAADALKLVSWAKRQADAGQINVIMVGSEQSTELIGNSDFRTRGVLVMCYPPSSNETRKALENLISTHPHKYKLNVEECLYLRGTCPTEYLPEFLGSPEELLKKRFERKHVTYKMKGRGFNDLDFWFKLIVAGSNGVALVEHESLVDDMNKHYVPDRNKVMSELCIQEYEEKLYFISGRSRELHAALVNSVYSAEAERLSVELSKSQSAEGERPSVEDCEKSQKLAMINERIAKIKECMSEKSYEAYGPSHETERPVKAEPV